LLKVNHPGYFRKKISILALLATAILMASAGLGFFLSRVYFLGPIAALPLGYLIIKTFQEMRKFKRLSALRKRWGVRETHETEPYEISKYFRKKAPFRESKYVVDDRTWSDLDMDLVYGRLNQTLTVPGEQVLYDLLRNPHFSQEPLEERSRIISLFLQNQDMRERTQLILSKLSKSGGKYFVDLLWDARPAPNRYAFFYWGILLFIPFFVLLGLLGNSLGWFGLIAMFLGNMAIHYRTKRKFAEDLPSIRYLGKMVKCAVRLGNLRNPLLEAYEMRLKLALAKVSRIAQKTTLLSLGENDALYEYLNILFLIEVRAFHSFLKLMEKYESQLRDIFETIGFLDAMAATASYKSGLKKCVEPELADSSPFLSIQDAVHPLLEKPVPNSISLKGKGLLITGSNMSGKTTFLKTLGVNMVLAQTLYFCLAKSFRSSFFNTVTLIGRKDNIIEGKSYYLDEILTLMRILLASRQEIPCLCLMDEIFRGTNSLERISASAEVLLYLAKQNGLVIVSTHDLELTRLVTDFYVNYHFQEEIGEYGILFNYQLHEGPAETRNAIKLLRHVGYPEEITEAAERRIRDQK
jgi:hypothetical protein